MAAGMAKISELIEGGKSHRDAVAEVFDPTFFFLVPLWVAPRRCRLSSLLRTEIARRHSPSVAIASSFVRVAPRRLALSLSWSNPQKQKSKKR